MALKGKFEWFFSLRMGGRKAISFTLTCDNLFQAETFDCAILANGGIVQPMIFRQLNLKAKQSLLFNFDTVDWEWCNGDSFVILGKNDSVKHQWPLNLQMYGPGECPDCHGTHKCRKCSGKGYLNLPNHNIEQCPACKGSGICQTCYIPQRISQTLNQNQQPSTPNQSRDRHIDNLRKRIVDIQGKIEKTQWDMRIMQLRNMDVTNSSVYLSYNQLLHKYNLEIIELQHKITQLEQL